MVYHDFTFDKFHKDGDRIYRMVTDFETSSGDFHNLGSPIPLRESVKNDITGIENSTALYRWWMEKSTAVESSKELRNPDLITFTQPSYFEIFTYDWITADAALTLNEPNNVVMTASRAQLYFPDLSPNQVVGKTIDYGQTRATITGIVADFEENSDFVFQEFISISTANQTNQKRQVFENGWDTVSSSNQLFVKLSKNADLVTIQNQLDQLANEHQSEIDLSYGNKTFFSIQPLADIHFNEDYGIYDYSLDQASKPVLLALAGIALFLLLLGIINFINLNTAQATKRAREIGVRKTLGSSRSQLIYQFLGETFLLTLTAAVVSIFLAMFLLQIFEDFISPEINMQLLLQPAILLGTIFLLGIVTLAAGFYPGMVLSRFKPSKVLKGNANHTSVKSPLRKTLTVFQFTIAQVYIIGTLLVGQQIQFLMSQDMGFNADTTAYIKTPYSSKDFSKKEVLASELKKIPQINTVSLANMPPASNSTFSNNASLLNNGQEFKTEIEFSNGDGTYLDLYQIELLAGRKPLNDTIKEYVINEAALKAFGFKNPEEAINQQIEMDGEFFPIVGVMSNFNQRSLKTSISPLAFTGDTSRKNWSQFTNVHFNLPRNKETKISDVIEKLEAEYNKVYPDTTFELVFVDEVVANFYRREQQMKKLLHWSTGLAVLISCLGLLGLVIHTTERRTKEIGIRKVLGASIMQINALLCKEFLSLVLIAFLIATPIAYYFLNNWLTDFAYRTDISIWVFLAGGVSMIFISILIMSFRTISTALKNPVKSLKTE
ncbi:putative FtsX-related transmembrane transport protein [Nonlabens dokdonensis DSW-6]|nr:putative FtsX-related transmembrane transport protein [Nonlabens dokdonensis DSW-6]